MNATIEKSEFAGTLQFRLASSREELEEIYRFRYRIYVEEMHRPQRYADHDSKQICDSLDRSGHVLGVWNDDQVIGTVRTNFLRECEIGEYNQFYNTATLGGRVRSCSITTRLMIDPNWRKGRFALRISQWIYQFALERDVTVDLIDCNAPLVPFFSRLGYAIHRNDLTHPEYGAVTVMKLEVRDAGHMARTGSALLPILRRWEATRETETNLV
jgi:predicted GNAT family N-acyltransferase